MESSEWNVAKDLEKLREMTQSPGGTPSRWVRQMAAEIIRLSKERDDWRELQHSAAQCLANRIKESEARGREIDRLREELEQLKRTREQEREYADVCYENERLRVALRQVYEVWAGSDGFIPQTAAEGYQQRLIFEMRDAAALGLGITGVPTADKT